MLALAMGGCILLPGPDHGEFDRETPEPTQLGWLVEPEPGGVAWEEQPILRVEVHHELQSLLRGPRLPRHAWLELDDGDRIELAYLGYEDSARPDTTRISKLKPSEPLPFGQVTLVLVPIVAGEDHSRYSFEVKDGCARTKAVYDQLLLDHQDCQQDQDCVLVGGSSTCSCVHVIEAPFGDPLNRRGLSQIRPLVEELSGPDCARWIERAAPRHCDVGDGHYAVCREGTCSVEVVNRCFLPP